MSKKTLKEIGMSDVVKGLVGAYIFNKVVGAGSKAGQLKAKVATLDKAIAKELADIDKSIEQNRKEVEKRFKKLPPERQKRLAQMAKQWS